MTFFGSICPKSALWALLCGGAVDIRLQVSDANAETHSSQAPPPEFSLLLHQTRSTPTCGKSVASQTHQNHGEIPALIARLQEPLRRCETLRSRPPSVEQTPSKLWTEGCCAKSKVSVSRNQIHESCGNKTDRPIRLKPSQMKGFQSYVNTLCVHVCSFF